MNLLPSPSGEARYESPDSVRAVFLAGDAGARLLAGPPASAGAEGLSSHLGRLGAPSALAGADLVEVVAASGLKGRGGAGFPVAQKLNTVRVSAGKPLVVVNCSESEPASAKDRTLVRLRPHLVLDGAAVAARAVGASQAVLYLHRGDLRSARALDAAVAERKQAAIADPDFSVAWAPPRYVAGESSAIVRFLEGGEAKPRFGTRAAICGVNCAPTAIHNVETLAHLALVDRMGPDEFRRCGTPGFSGSVLVTLAGAVQHPGLVAELVAPVPASELLGVAGISSPPQALLVGGYGGAWIDGRSAWDSHIWPDALLQGGISVGCGLVGVFPNGACGVRETSGILSYLASESAGQCGPCRYGLDHLANSLARLAKGEAGRRELKALERKAASIVGRGACSHPDGAVSLLRHCLEVFEADIRSHSQRRPCRAAHSDSVFPLPSQIEQTWR